MKTAVFQAARRGHSGALQVLDLLSTLAIAHLQVEVLKKQQLYRPHVAEIKALSRVFECELQVAAVLSLESTCRRKVAEYAAGEPHSIAILTYQIDLKRKAQAKIICLQCAALNALYDTLRILVLDALVSLLEEQLRSNRYKLGPQGYF